MSTPTNTSTALLDVNEKASSSPLRIVSKEKETEDSSVKAPPKITRLPPSQALLQARAFLPMLAKANDDLGKNGEDVNIENVDEDQPHVEMNFSLTENQDSDSDDSEDSNDNEQHPIVTSPQPKTKPGIEEL